MAVNVRGGYIFFANFRFNDFLIIYLATEHQQLIVIIENFGFPYFRRDFYPIQQLFCFSWPWVLCEAHHERIGPVLKGRVSWIVLFFISFLSLSLSFLAFSFEVLVFFLPDILLTAFQAKEDSCCQLRVWFHPIWLFKYFSCSVL